MKEYLIIGDIAGNYNTLKALLAKCPGSAVPVSVGDMVDRGPRSKEVLEFFMNNGLAVMGNHESLMIDFLINEFNKKDGYYDDGLWIMNGGGSTLNSFRDEYGDYDISKDLLNWMSKLPLYLKFEGFTVTHAPIRGDFKLEQCINIGYGFNRSHKAKWLAENGMDAKCTSPDDSVLWNRGKPKRKTNLGVQFFGHNAVKKVDFIKDNKGLFAVNCDTSRARVLSAVHWPSLEVFEQEYID